MWFPVGGPALNCHLAHHRPRPAPPGHIHPWRELTGQFPDPAPPPPHKLGKSGPISLQWGPLLGATISLGSRVIVKIPCIHLHKKRHLYSFHEY